MQRIPEYQGEVFMQEFVDGEEAETFDFKKDLFTQRFILGKKSLLDIPCGIGREAYSLAVSFPGLKVVGIDIYRPCIDFANREFGNGGLLEFKVGDIYHLNGEKADVVRIVCSLHHLEDLEEVFANVGKALPETGQVVIGDFNRAASSQEPVSCLWAQQREKWGDAYVELFSQDNIVVKGVSLGRGTAMYLDSKIAAYTSQEVQEALHRSGFKVDFCEDYDKHFGLIA